jgi:cytochrome c biogenesis protein CcmG, thiol:disulfide interchange protein DsbE
VLKNFEVNNLKKRQYGFVLILVCIILAATVVGVRLGSRHQVADSAKPVEGFPAPNFSLPDLNDKTVTLKRITAENKVTLINFWATWCAPCRAEIPEFIKLYRNYSTRGLKILAINLRDQPKAVKRFAQKAGMRFPVLTDTTGKIGDLYQIFSIPSTFVIDQKGTIRSVIKGSTTFNALDKKVRPLLKGK